jgi:putative ABC transport system permease protein
LLTAVRAPLAVTWARARRRPGRGLLAAAGTAVATAALLGVSGGSVITAELELHAALGRLGPADRSFTATWLGAPPPSGYGSIDDAAVAALRRLTPVQPARTLGFPELNLGGTRLALGGVDDPGRWLRLRSGRLPQSCTAARCEVLQAAGSPLAVVSEPGLRLVVVGRTAGPLPFDLATLTRPAHGNTSPPPVLVAGSVAQLTAVPALQALYRRYGWTAPLSVGATHDWAVPGLLAREGRAAQALGRLGTAFGLTGPADALAQAHADDQVAARRLLLVGGGAAALLLAFVVLASGGLRRDARAEWDRLERHGARAWQLWLHTASEAAWIALAGVVAGAAAAAVCVRIAAGRAGADAGGVLAHSVLTPAALALAAAAWAAATVVIVATVRLEAGSVRVGPVHVLDLVALASVAAALLAADRGAATPASLAGGTDPLLAILPGLAALATAAVVARLAGPALRLASRWSHRGPVALRLALASAGRQGGRTALGAAYVAAAVGLALFALSYRATLRQGEVDQAAFQVPLDYTVTEGPALRRPLAVAPVSAYRRLAPGAVVAPVLRLQATLAGPGAPVQPALLGIPASVLPRLHWRGDDAAASPARLAGLLASSPAPRTVGAPLPAGARIISLRVRGSGRPVELHLAVRQTSGGYGEIVLGQTVRGVRVLRAAIPAVDAGGSVVALQIGLRPADARAQAHAGIEGGLTIVARGAITTGALRADGATVTSLRTWVGRDAARREGTSTIGYALDGRTDGLLRPAVPGEGTPLPLVVSPDVAAAAAAGGRLQIVLADGRSLPARVAAVATRFPTAPGTFVVADEARLAAAMNADRPGSAVPAELWLGVPSDRDAAVAGALRRPPFADLGVASRTALQAQASARPLARGVLVVLELTAAVAVLLAAAGLVVVGVSDLADERPHLRDLEAIGVAPRTLRRHLVARAALVAAAGAAGGVALGAVLAFAVTDLVQLGAGTAAAVPPLRTAVDLPGSVLVLVVAAAGGLVPVWALAGRPVR